MDNALTDATPGKHDFRFSFKLAQKPKEATLFITAKDNVAAWVNGKQVVVESPMGKFGRPSDPWGYFRVIAVGKLLTPAPIPWRLRRLFNRSTTGLPQAGFIALLRVEMADGKIERFVSGPEWKTGAGANGQRLGGAERLTIHRGPRGRGGGNRPGTAGHALAGAAGRPAAARISAWPRQVRSARIYSTALGTYQLYLNGQRVGNDVLAPGWTDYRKRIVYQVYDVTSQVRQGGNALGAILGGGWYADGLGWLQTRYQLRSAAGPPAGATRNRIHRRLARFRC